MEAALPSLAIIGVGALVGGAVGAAVGYGIAARGNGTKAVRVGVVLLTTGAVVSALGSIALLVDEHKSASMRKG